MLTLGFDENVIHNTYPDRAEVTLADEGNAETLQLGFDENVIHNTGSGDWGTETTWSPQRVPTAADDVFLDYPDRAEVTLADEGNAETLTVSNLNTLLIDNVGGSVAYLTVTGWTKIDCGGEIHIKSGTFNAGPVWNEGTLHAEGGTINAGPVWNEGNLKSDGGTINASSLWNFGSISGKDGQIDDGRFYVDNLFNYGTINIGDSGSIMVNDLIV